MSKTYIPVIVRRQVYALANDCCEYCRYPAAFAHFTFHIDHIVPEKHGGPTEMFNLALSCRACNLAKGDSVVAYSMEWDRVVRLFNPRRHPWQEHFSFLDSGRIKPLTDIGTATTLVLRMNHETRVKERFGLMQMGLLS